MIAPKPTHPLDYPDDLWTCDITGAGPVPKLIESNLTYRASLIKSAEDDPALQQGLMDVCSKSPLYFFNVFCWCYRPKWICEDSFERLADAHWTDTDGVEHIVPPADQPVITWPAQDAFVNGLVDSIRQGGQVLVPKSRNQGATLLLMMVCTWGLLFWPRFSALCVSRREDLVENLTEDSLLGKLHHAISKLPPWMVPGKITRTLKPIKTICEARGTMILGESANEDVGQSRRVFVVVVDEAARFLHGGRTLMKSIATVGNCTVLASTPNGPGTAFSKLCLKQTANPSRQVKLLELSYADSPTHGKGRKWTIDEDGAITGTVGGGYWETPAFKSNREQAISAKQWRENWLISHDTSGLCVLNSSAISRLRQAVRTPRRGMLTDGKFHEINNGKLYVWLDPHPHTNYIIGGDFGQGVEQSNSVLAVMDRGTGCVVAEFVSPSHDAYELVPIAMAMGRYYGGEWENALMIWENNGPGIAFGREIVRQHYPHLYYQRAETMRTDSESKQYGWTSNPQRKEIAFSDLNKALVSGTFTTWCDVGLDDMATWIYDEHGRIVCGSLRDETTGAQARHGDRGIAYMLCVKGMDYTYPYEDVDDTKAAPGTFAAMLGHDEVWEEIERRNEPLAQQLRSQW